MSRVFFFLPFSTSHMLSGMKNNLHGHIPACWTHHQSPTARGGWLCAISPDRSPDSFSRDVMNSDFNSCGQGLWRSGWPEASRGRVSAQVGRQAALTSGITVSLWSSALGQGADVLVLWGLKSQLESLSVQFLRLLDVPTLTPQPPGQSYYVSLKRKSTLCDKSLTERETHAGREVCSCISHAVKRSRVVWRKRSGPLEMSKHGSTLNLLLDLWVHFLHQVLSGGEVVYLSHYR